jgi:hypothetical protein
MQNRETEPIFEGVATLHERTEAAEWLTKQGIDDSATRLLEYRDKSFDAALVIDWRRDSAT